MSKQFQHIGAANDSVERARKKSRVVKVGKKLRRTFNGIAASQSSVPVDPVLEPSIFPWTQELASNWQAIAAEATAVLAYRDAVPPLKDLSPDHARIASDGKWKSFFLIGYGYEIPENCGRAPKTAELVRKIPGLNSAFFSILDAGADIPRHRGVTRGIVTCHLGLIIPDQPEQCTMLVEDQTTHWREGEWLIFDDSYHHEVHNRTAQQRVILLLQVERPMRWLGRMANNVFLGAIRRTPFVQDARKNLHVWEEVYKKAERDS